MSITSGLKAYPPQEIADLLGSLEPGMRDDLAVPDLIGAVMSLCRRVAELEARLETQESARNQTGKQS